MVEHPIVKLLQAFREILLEFLREKSDAITTGASFYERQTRLKFEMEQNEKLLNQVKSDIIGFV